MEIYVSEIYFMEIEIGIAVIEVNVYERDVGEINRILYGTQFNGEYNVQTTSNKIPFLVPIVFSECSLRTLPFILNGLYGYICG